MWTLDEVERQLRTSMVIWGRHANARRMKDHLLSEYHRGLATGIFVTLGATGRSDVQQRLARELLREDDADATFLTGLFMGTGLRPYR